MNGKTSLKGTGLLYDYLKNVFVAHCYSILCLRMRRNNKNK